MRYKRIASKLYIHTLVYFLIHPLLWLTTKLKPQRNLHVFKAFPSNPVVCFFEVDKTFVDGSSILPRLLESSLEGWNFISSTDGTKTVLEVLQLWLTYFTESFSQGFGKHFISWLRREMLRYFEYSSSLP